MAEIIDLTQYLQEEPDLDELDREGLLQYRAAVEAEIEALDAREPRDMFSEEYEEWGDAHEELEDLLDEILDRLDDLRT